MEKVESDIWFLEADEQLVEGELWKKGYYFQDETENLNGPFDTIEEARRHLAQYAASL